MINKCYDGFGPNQGIHIDSENALEYALQHCHVQEIPGETIDPEFAEMVEEWFYSGNWV